MKDAWKAVLKAIRKLFMWVLHIVATPFISTFKAASVGFADLADKLEKATNPIKD